MKKYFPFLIIGALTINLVLFFNIEISQAACPPNAICIDNPLNASTTEELVNDIIGFIFWVAVAVAPIMFLVAGFYFITAGGDPKRVGTAKTIMIYTAIGLAIVLLARALVSVLKSVLGG